MPGVLRTKPTGIRLEDVSRDSTVGRANAQVGFKPLSFFEATVNFMSMQWLAAGDKFATSDLQQDLKDNCINVGVVAALIFTMVGFGQEGAGSELVELTNGTVTQEASDGTLSCLSSIALWCLFGAVLHSLYMYCQIAQLKGPTEVEIWSHVMGSFLTNAHFLYLIVGFVFYIFSQVWFALTVMPLGAFATSLAVLIFAVAIPLVLFSIRGVQAIYKAKATLAQDYGGSTAPVQTEKA